MTPRIPTAEENPPSDPNPLPKIHAPAPKPQETTLAIGIYADNPEFFAEPRFNLLAVVVVTSDDDYNGEGRNRFVVVGVEYLGDNTYIYALKPYRKDKVCYSADQRWVDEDDIIPEADERWLLEATDVPF